MYHPAGPVRRIFSYLLIPTVFYLGPLAFYEQLGEVNDDEHWRVLMANFVGMYTTIGISGSIMVQVSVTSFVLPEITKTHWMVRAFFIATVETAGFGVYFSALLHGRLTTMHKLQQFKDWLTNPDKQYSIFAVFVLFFPGVLMFASIVLFALGFALYLLLLWKQVSHDAGDRNVFVLGLLTGFICVLVWWVPNALRKIEKERRKAQRWQDIYGIVSERSEERGKFAGSAIPE